MYKAYPPLIHVRCVHDFCSKVYASKNIKNGSSGVFAFYSLCAHLSHIHILTHTKAHGRDQLIKTHRVKYTKSWVKTKSGILLWKVGPSHFSRRLQHSAISERKTASAWSGGLVTLTNFRYSNNSFGFCFLRRYKKQSSNCNVTITTLFKLSTIFTKKLKFHIHLRLWNMTSVLCYHSLISQTMLYAV